MIDKTERLGKIARIELLIENYGVCGAMEMFAQAIENIRDTKDVDSEEYLNYQHSLNVIESVMNAVDLDYLRSGDRDRDDKFYQMRNDIAFIDLKKVL